ncbi:MAG: hypothetical protein QXY16_02510 [Nanopusillaceae archaeon]
MGELLYNKAYALIYQKVYKLLEGGKFSIPFQFFPFYSIPFHFIPFPDWQKCICVCMFLRFTIIMVGGDQKKIYKVLMGVKIGKNI